MTPQELKRSLDSCDRATKLEIDRILSLPSDAVPFFPNKGPQLDAFHCEADELFYGGAAGGGKTALLCGLALSSHSVSRIFRREFVQLDGLETELFRLAGTREGYNGQKRLLVRGKRRVQLAAMQREDDWQDYQGRPADLIGFDEIPHFTENQYRSAIGWLRSVDKSQRCRVAACGNPPTSAEGEWVIRYWAPWLDPNHPNPAAPGELRWFTTINGVDTEVPDGSPIVIDGETIIPMSRTFIPALLDDNPHLKDTGYRARLQALPKNLRVRLLRGSFTTISDDPEFQVIPTDWIEAAMQRWEQGTRPALSITAAGVDPSRGGSDDTVIAPRRGAWYDTLVESPGAKTPDGNVVAKLIQETIDPQTLVCLDTIGIGAAVYDAARDLPGSQMRIIPCVASESTDETDSTGQLKMVNMRALWWWRMREALDPNSGVNVYLPRDSKLKAELAAPRWSWRDGVQVEAKDQIKKRLGRSTDRADAVVMAWAHGGMGMASGLSAPIFGSGTGFGNNLI